MGGAKLATQGNQWFKYGYNDNWRLPRQHAFHLNLNLTTVVHYGIYLENREAPVQPHLEASHDSNISKYYSHTSIHVYVIYLIKF